MSGIATLDNKVIGSQSRPDYDPNLSGTKPYVGQLLEVTFRKRDDNRWVATEQMLEGTTEFCIDRMSAHEPTDEQTKWRINVQRIFKDEPSRYDRSLYYRQLFVTLIEPVVSNRARKRLEKVRQQNPSVQQTTVMKPEPKKTNRVLKGICFVKTGDVFTYSFYRADGVIELYKLVDKPAALMVHKYHHLKGEGYTVPVHVEVVRELDSESANIKKFEVKVVETN